MLCSRAKQPFLETVVDGEKTLVAEPWESIQDKRLKYEMTLVVPMTLDGAYETDPARLDDVRPRASEEPERPAAAARRGEAGADRARGRSDDGAGGFVIDVKVACCKTQRPLRIGNGSAISRKNSAGQAIRRGRVDNR